MSPAQKYYLGIDIGTYESKGVIIDPECEVVSSAVVNHSMENPKAGYFEHDAETVWWYDFCKLSHSLLLKGGISPDEIAGIGASALGSDCLPVDMDCRPLRKAILYGIDARSQKEIEFMNEYYGKDVVRKLFGRPICSGDVAAKILWIKNNEPEVYQKTYKFLTGSSYITAKLTGNYVIDQFLAQATFKPLYNDDGSFCTEHCALYCKPDQLAEARWVQELAGYVTRKAAEETGLCEGTPVITGTGDSCAEAISTGVLQAGDLMLQVGSSLFFYCCTDHLIHDDRVRGNNFTIPGTYSIAAGTNTAGALTRWFRQEIFRDIRPGLDGHDMEVYDIMNQGLEKIPPGSDGLITLPYFAGERTPINDPNARGMIFGLRLNHTREHLYRSALESVGYSIGQHIDIFRECGVKLEKISVVGGGTKNRLWMQIISDIIGLPIQLTRVSIGACYGDAMMAALGTGRFASFAELRQYIHLAEVFMPNFKRHEVYKKYRKIYDELYRKNSELMHQL